MSLEQVDLAVFRAINGLGFAPLDWLFMVVSTPEFGLTAAALISLWFAWKKKWEAVWIVLAGVAAVVLCDAAGARLLKPLFHRVRPCFALPRESVRLLVQIAPSGSMPSLHAANNAAAALVAFFAERRTAFALFPLAVLVALSRVCLGVHWPTDLLAGFVWGALAALAGWFVARGVRWLFFRARGKSEPAPAAQATAPFSKVQSQESKVE